MFAKSLMAEGFTDARTVDRIMRSAVMKDLITQARTTPARRTLHPAVYELLTGEIRRDPADGVQLDLVSHLADAGF